MNERIEALREALAGTDCDAFFSISPPDNQYLSGMLTSFMEMSSVLIITAKEAHFLCDFRYTEQARAEVTGFEISEIKGDGLARAGEWLTRLGAQNVAFDPAVLSVAELGRLRAAYTGEMEQHPALVQTLRLIKSPEEIELIRAASELAEGVMTDIVPTLQAGVLERDVAAAFEFEFKKRGATATSFDTIALFGSKSSLPHGEPGEKALVAGDVMLFDFGCRMEGYCSDMTRTYVFQESPGGWFDEIYTVTLEAQLAGLDAIRAGVTGKEVDAVSRSIITDAGFGDYFGHGLGHGVGVEIHEPPRLNTESRAVLKPGMVVTVEPGIYLPGKGGVRIEDLVVVTESGCDLLTKASKELIIQG